MNFIKKIFDGKNDDMVHLQFKKFSRGEFTNRALISAKNSGKKYTLTTSSEFANELVKNVAEKLGVSKASVSGAIVSTRNLKEEPTFSQLLAHAEVKQFQGVKKFMVNNEMSGQEILRFLEECPTSFFALSFNADKDNTTLKIKPKALKSGKPGTKGGDAPKADFCKLVTEDGELAKSFILEKSEFKEARINHTFVISEIIFPKGETDYAKIREMAKRKGKILRNAIIDGQEIKTEKDFEA